LIGLRGDAAGAFQRPLVAMALTQQYSAECVQLMIGDSGSHPDCIPDERIQ
jgi:hypothetical protein